MDAIPVLILPATAREDSVLPALVAHELRTPLSTLGYAAGVLRVVVGDDTVGVAALGMIDRQVRVLLRLVNDLVDKSRLRAGELSVIRTPCDLNEILRCAANTCEPALAARGHQLQFFVSARPLPVMADFDRLVQVFVNLLDNAIKYTPTGGTIWLMPAIEGDEIVVRLRDSGVGMSASALPHVFELFSQDPATKSMANGGVGIGLALVQSIVRMHQGTVHAKSDGPGKGSEFTVRLALRANCIWIQDDTRESMQRVPEDQVTSASMNGHR